MQSVQERVCDKIFPLYTCFLDFYHLKWKLLLLIMLHVGWIGNMAGEYWNKDVVQLERATIASGGNPPITDAYTINGHAGPNYNCSNNGNNLYWLIMTNLWKPTSSNHLLLKTASKVIKLVILVKQDVPINQMLEIFLIHISQTIKQFHWLISIRFLPCIEIFCIIL